MKKYRKILILSFLYILITIGSDFDARAVVSNDSFDFLEFECIKKNEIQSDTLYEFEVIDSFYVITEDNRIVDIKTVTWGNGFLWILNGSDWKPDTIYQVNPETKTLINSYQIPIPDSYWSIGFDYDSASIYGPYFWLSVCKQSVVGSYYDVGLIYKLRVKGTSISNLFNLPDSSPSAIAFHNDSIWITGQQNNLMYIFDLKSGKFSPLFTIRNGTYAKEINQEQYDNLTLWMIDWNYKGGGEFGYEKIIIKMNPYTGKNIRSFRAPGPWPFGICWENETPGGPFLWICDIETQKVYKVREPSVNSVLEDGQKINISKINYTPNPFYEKTKISFNIGYPSYTKITIYNSLGYKLAVLADEFLSEGLHEFTFDGSALASGTFYYVLQANGKVETGKLVLIK